ncbi:desulfoferrodoxin family protein [Thiotrichales bacterium HSG1]|nr:desulfoferrodoxin family protein [Thiotrichales bacterium HSG1]
MKNRRNFLKTSLVISTGIVTTNTIPAFASTKSFPNGIIYTKDNPGKWEKKVAGHIPIITIDGKQVTIETKHGMSEKHYIVKHTVVSGNGEVLGEKIFYPTDKNAVSVFKLEEKHTVLYATSFCNKHDLWVAEFSI